MLESDDMGAAIDTRGAVWVWPVVTVLVAGACQPIDCPEGACAQPTATTTTTEATSTTTGTSTSTTTTTDEPTTTGTSTTTGPPPPECGNGVVEDGEACDDGNDDDADMCRTDCTLPVCGDGIVQPTEQCDDGNDDDTDVCVSGCALARCGDGFVQAGVEQCDAGASNGDGSYGGCTSECKLGARCGDAIVNGPEDCDDANDDETDGCLSSCIEARSCLHLKEVLSGAPSGIYRLWPAALGGEGSVLAWCDMETDGGGYTFLKIDTEFGDESDKGAKKAEAICKQYGMRLIVTRTPAHTVAAYNVAVSENIPPIGGGKVASGADYLAIMGIYPVAQGATCDGQPLNSEKCPGWQAGDGQPYWVTDTPVPGQPDDEHCLGCSMFYKWNPDGTLKNYVTVSFGEGASSYRFMCDVGDKHP
ncbi:MAG TPA: DUF4215 domain-containing protein [Nannocystis sp.]